LIVRQGNLKNLQKKSSEITNGIKQSQDQLEILNREAKKTLDIIKDFQDGGESFCIFDLYYSPPVPEVQAKGFYLLEMRIQGITKMRDVKVTVLNSPLDVKERKKMEILRGSFDNLKIVYDNPGQIKVTLGDLEWYVNPPLLRLEEGDYKDGFLKLSISVESENFNTRQEIVAFDMTKGINDDKIYSRVTISGGDREGELKYERITDNFPRNDKGDVDMKKIIQILSN